MAETVVQQERFLEEMEEHPSSSTNVTDTGEPSASTELFIAQRPKRVELSEEEVVRRMEAFPARKDQFVAAIRASKQYPF